jgi:glutamate synthase (NADPH/NADH) large chain
VVVIGPTGRNFGAGMSGGVAFVLDEAGDFRGLVNPEMVDVDPLDGDDVDWLRDRIERHVAETESAVGRRLLDDWDAAATRFLKVMPRDYKRVLGPTPGRADGTDPMEAVMAAARA